MIRDDHEFSILSGIGVDNTAIFERVQSAYDLALLAKAHVVIVGTGGAAGLVDDLARTGIGRLTLIDKDQVSVENLATQQTYAYDIHVSKAQAIASRLRYINPSVAVTTYAMPVAGIDDAEFASLLETPPVVLVGCTDNFYAQARVHRLSLQFGVPCLCAQLWYEGRGGEITITHPDIVPSACHRCMLVARYNAYLEDGFINDVTSHASR